MLSEPLGERFWSKVAKTDGCWLWTGATVSDGYGIYWRTGRNADGYTLAHRLSMAEASDAAIPAGVCVCHTCDNPLCVNPAHLFLASHAENMADRRAKGRHRLCGPRGPNLSKEDVLYIRSAPRTAAELSTEFGVTRRTIHSVRQGRTHAHVA